MSLFVNVQIGDKLVRCLDIDNVRWYCCRDIALSLGYKCTRQAISLHIDEKFIKTMIDLYPNIILTANNKTTKFTQHDGLQQLIIKSQLPNAIDIAKELGIDVHKKFLRKEIEIIGFVQEFLTGLGIPFCFQHSINQYKIDLYLPNHKLAIEIDENGHSERNQIYEQKRQQDITNLLDCKFLRVNPDDVNFKISLFLADIVKHIYSQNQ